MTSYQAKLTQSDFLTNRRPQFSDHAKECMKIINIEADSLLFSMKSRIEASLFRLISKENLYEMIYSLVKMKENSFLKIIHRLSTVIKSQESIICKLKVENEKIKSELLEKRHKDNCIVMAKRRKKYMKTIRKLQRARVKEG